MNNRRPAVIVSNDGADGNYASGRKIAPRDCDVWGAAHSRQSTTEEIDSEREFRKNRTTPPE
jgi:hypothetical protein